VAIVGDYRRSDVLGSVGQPRNSKAFSTAFSTDCHVKYLRI